MKSKVYDSFDEAIADVPDGATIMFPGFGGVGMPRNLILALARQGASNLTGISNYHGYLSSIVDVGVLVETGQIKKMVCSFTGPRHPSRLTHFIKLYEKGEVEGELVPQGTMIERIRAASAGIGGFYTRTSINTELAEGKEHREIDGKTYVLEYPLHADYAFIRAWKADTLGNLQFRLAQRNFNPVMAMAAKITVVEVENDIVQPGDLDPDHIHTPGIFVDRVVSIPPDGIWETVDRNRAF